MQDNTSIFNEIHKDKNCRARTGLLHLPHGTVQTPVFMPVGTNATVKALTKDDLEEIGFEIILANTYHLFLRPGVDILEKAGGLHGFSKWNRNFLTDSGGFQVFSLATFRKIKEEGVTFQSHIDGSRHFFSPESVVQIQRRFNSDIQMQLDVCTGYGIGEKEAKEARKVDNEVDSLKYLMAQGKEYWQKVLEWGSTRRLLSDMELSIIKMVINMDVTGRIPSVKQAKVVIKARERLIADGMPLQF